MTSSLGIVVLLRGGQPNHPATVRVKRRTELTRTEGVVLVDGEGATVARLPARHLPEENVRKKLEIWEVQHGKLLFRVAGS